MIMCDKSPLFLYGFICITILTKTIQLVNTHNMMSVAGVKLLLSPTLEVAPTHFQHLGMCFLFLVSTQSEQFSLLRVDDTSEDCFLFGDAPTML